MTLKNILTDLDVESAQPKLKPLKVASEAGSSSEALRIIGRKHILNSLQLPFPSILPARPRCQLGRAPGFAHLLEPCEFGRQHIGSARSVPRLWSPSADRSPECCGSISLVWIDTVLMASTILSMRRREQFLGRRGDALRALQRMLLRRSGEAHDLLRLPVGTVGGAPAREKIETSNRLLGKSRNRTRGPDWNLLTILRRKRPHSSRQCGRQPETGSYCVGAVTVKLSGPKVVDAPCESTATTVTLWPPMLKPDARLIRSYPELR